MTRLDLLKILVGQARTNGFDFRYWYTTSLRRPWGGQNAAIEAIADERRYYALLFNHQFAQSFWKAGTTITFQIPAHQFQRSMPDGSIRIVQRKPFMRRSARRDAWRYHLREMAVAEEPLRYMRKYLHVDEDLTDDSETGVALSNLGQTPPAVPRPGLNTLALARAAAERRQREVDALPMMPAKSSKRRARVPGSK